MKSKILFFLLIIVTGISIYFTYQRSFVWGNFDMVNSNEESEDTIETTAPANDVVSETSMSEDDSASSTLETATTSNMGSSY